MSKASDPKIKDHSGEESTKISFSPDLAKFGLEKIDDDHFALLSRRAYDAAAATRGVKVFLNGKRIPVKGFKDYVDLFLKEGPKTCMNFLKLCKAKAYNLNLFHTVQSDFIAQTGDPSGTGRGGESIFCQLYGEQVSSGVTLQ